MRHQTAPVGLVLALLFQQACATELQQRRAVVEPPVSLPDRPEVRGTLGLFAGPRAAERTSSGMRVIKLDQSPSAFSAAFLIEGGALDDPPNLPGLTAWLPEAALLEVQSRGGDALTPHQRAFKHGGTILPIADGRWFGWAVAGPHLSAAPLLNLLRDVALRASYPAAEIQMLARQSRMRLEAEQDDKIRDAINVAAGMALGLDRPLAVQPTLRLFNDVNREHLVRHHRMMVRPEHTVMVLSSPKVPVPPELLGWTTPPSTLKSQATCRPHGQEVHALIDNEREPERSLMLLATALPRGDATQKAAIAATLRLLDSFRSLWLEPQLGRDQAERATPTLVSVGGRGVRARDILMFGTLGSPKEAERDLRIVGRLLADGLPERLDAAALQHATRLLTAERRERLSGPISALLEAANDALAPWPETAPTEREVQSVAQAIFSPWRFTLAALGSPEIYDLLASRGPVIQWGSDLAPPFSAAERRRCEPDLRLKAD